jgi:hypothetical protein
LHIVTEYDSAGVENLVLFKLECGLALINQDIVQPFSVNIVDETITKNSLIFVDPHSAEVHWLKAQLVVSVTQALEDTRDISQVKCVM